MKRVILVISHLGAGSASLCYCLAQNSIIQWIPQGITYDDPVQSVESILATKHKYSEKIGLYVNEVLYNYQISHKKVYEACQFIYLVRDPKSAIRIVKPNDAVFALNYYIFRLRRIYEMTKETKGALFLTWDDLVSQKGVKYLTKKFDLPETVFEEYAPEKKLFELPKPMLAEAARAYELLLYRVKNIGQVVRC